MRIFTKRKLAFYLNLIIIIAAFLISIWPKSATVRVYLPKYWRPFLGFSAIWLSIAILAGKYNFDVQKKFIYNWLKIFRADIYSLAFILVLLYFFNVFHYSRLVVFGTVLGAITLETLFLVIWYYSQRFKRDRDISTYLDAPPIEIEEEEEIEPVEFIKLPETESESVLQELKTIWLKEKTNLYEFIKKNTQIDKIPAEKTKVMFTHHLYNIQNTKEDSQLLFVNLHELNGWSRINKYLRQVNRNLQIGGYFVSCGEDYRNKHKRYFRDLPWIIAFIVTIIDFIFRRILQRLPGIRELYYAVFRESQKPFSQCELLGRVVYSGFELIDIQERDNLFYFIAQKKKEAPQREDPIYGPLIRMKRVGYKGKEIYLYKLRTMFPYAEYLQEFVFRKNRLEDSGKFKNDFRIMPWGNFFRRTWIDELPQLYNLFKGDIKLVGVRAISFHYFSLYPKEVQELRVGVKPGLVPPFYVDMPDKFGEIVASERKYLEEYQKHAFSTDLKYFFQAFYNIIFRHARSG